MAITLLAVGKIKENYLKDGIAEYVKRLSAYEKLQIIEVPDEPVPENASLAQLEKIKIEEGERLLRRLPSQAVLIALDGRGEQLSSPGFADCIAAYQLTGKSHLAFVIGGSLGLAKLVLQQAARSISFGPCTFPHQLMRLIFLEQLYRAYKINRGENYHK